MSQQPDAIDYARLNESLSSSLPRPAASGTDVSVRGLHAASDLGNTMDDMAAFGDTMESITVDYEHDMEAHDSNPLREYTVDALPKGPGGRSVSSRTDNAENGEDASGASGTAGGSAEGGTRLQQGDILTDIVHSVPTARSDHDTRKRRGGSDSKGIVEDPHESDVNSHDGTENSHESADTSASDDDYDDHDGGEDLDATIVLVEPDDDPTPHATLAHPVKGDDRDDTPTHPVPEKEQDTPVDVTAGTGLADDTLVLPRHGAYDDGLATPAMASHAPRPTMALGSGSARHPEQTARVTSSQTAAGFSAAADDDSRTSTAHDATHGLHDRWSTDPVSYHAKSQYDTMGKDTPTRAYQAHSDSLDLSEETTMMMQSATRGLGGSIALQSHPAPPRNINPAHGRGEEPSTETVPDDTSHARVPRTGTYDVSEPHSNVPLPGWAGARAAALSVLYPSTSERLVTMETTLGRTGGFPPRVPRSTYDVIESLGTVHAPHREHFDELARLRKELQQQEGIIKEYEQENVTLRTKVCLSAIING